MAFEGVPSLPWTSTLPDSGPVAAACGLYRLAPGAMATMTIVAKVKPTTTGELHADASVTGVTLDPSNLDNYAHTDTAVGTRPDLNVTLADPPDPVVAGTSLAYTATITNSAPSTARTVELTEDLDNDDDRLPRGEVVQPALDPVRVVHHLGAGALAAAGDAGGLEGEAGHPGPALPVRARQRHADDERPGDHQQRRPAQRQRQRVRVDLGTHPGRLAAGLTAPSHVYQPSTSVTYAATIRNNGPSDAQSAMLTVRLPAPRSATVSPIPDCASCTHTATTTVTTVTCTCPTLSTAVDRMFEAPEHDRPGVLRYP
jgi:hypothetical protein